MNTLLFDSADYGLELPLQRGPSGFGDLLMAESPSVSGDGALPSLGSDFAAFAAELLDAGVEVSSSRSPEAEVSSSQSFGYAAPAPPTSVLKTVRRAAAEPAPAGRRTSRGSSDRSDQGQFAAPKAKGKRHSSSKEAQRRAEKAHRLRKQNEKLTLEASVASLTEQFKRQATLNAGLALRVKVMERCAYVREAFAAAGGMACRQSHAGAPTCHITDDVCGGGGDGAVASDQLALAASHAGEPPGPECQALATLFRSTHGVIGSRQAAEADKTAAAAHCWRSAVAKLAPFVLDSAQALAADGWDPRLCKMASALRSVAAALQLHVAPDTYARLLRTDVSGGPRAPEEHDWRGVAASAGFTQEQRLEAAAVYDVFCDRVAALRAERAKLRQQLAELQQQQASDSCAAAGGPSASLRFSSSSPLAGGGASLPLAAPCSAAAAAHDARMHELLLRLEQNVKAEGVERLMLEAYQVRAFPLNPLQAAHMIVASYPFLPSAHDLFAAIHAELAAAGGAAAAAAAATALPVPAAAMAWPPAPCRPPLALTM